MLASLASPRNTAWRMSTSLASPRNTTWRMSASLASPRNTAWQMSASLASLAHFRKRRVSREYSNSLNLPASSHCLVLLHFNVTEKKVQNHKHFALKVKRKDLIYLSVEEGYLNTLPGPKAKYKTCQLKFKGPFSFLDRAMV